MKYKNHWISPYCDPKLMSNKLFIIPENHRERRAFRPLKIAIQIWKALHHDQWSKNSFSYQEQSQAFQWTNRISLNQEQMLMLRVTLWIACHLHQDALELDHVMAQESRAVLSRALDQASAFSWTHFINFVNKIVSEIFSTKTYGNCFSSIWLLSILILFTVWATLVAFINGVPSGFRINSAGINFIVLP